MKIPRTIFQGPIRKMKKNLEISKKPKLKDLIMSLKRRELKLKISMGNLKEVEKKTKLNSVIWWERRIRLGLN